jgi:hypothetical protein
MKTEIEIHPIAELDRGQFAADDRIMALGPGAALPAYCGVWSEWIDGVDSLTLSSIEEILNRGYTHWCRIPAVPEPPISAGDIVVLTGRSSRLLQVMRVDRIMGAGPQGRDLIYSSPVGMFFADESRRATPAEIAVFEAWEDEQTVRESVSAVRPGASGGNCRSRPASSEAYEETENHRFNVQ